MSNSFATPGTVTPLGSSVHQIYQARIRSGLPFPSPGDLPNPGIKLASPAWQSGSLPQSYQGNPINVFTRQQIITHYLNSWASLVAKMVKNCFQCRRLGFNPWVRKIPWRGEWLRTPVSFPGEFHYQSVVGHLFKESARSKLLS